MDPSAMSWLPDVDPDNTISIDQFISMYTTFDEDEVAVIQQDLEKCLSAENKFPSSLISESPEMSSEKLQEPNNLPNINPDHILHSSSAPVILNFGNSDGAEEEQPKKGAKKANRVRPPSQVYDHIIAERKRREQLSQQFHTLSTIVPGLKKMDKTSVLGDAIAYLKTLQERVNTLEEEAKNNPMESLVMVKRSQVVAEDDDNDETNESSDEQPLQKIEVRMYNDYLLIRIQCEKDKGVLANVLSKLDKLNLAVINTNVSTFGGITLDITVVAQKEKNFNLTIKQVVSTLRGTLQSTNYLRHLSN